MNNLTTKELALIEDELRAEEIIAKTMNWCAAMCQDREIRQTIEELAENHQMNIIELSSYFNNSQLIQ